MGSSVGWWRSCSGCTDGEDGYVNERFYPTHPKYGVPTGSGCSECKGKGVVFVHFTKADAEAMALEFSDRPTPVTAEGGGENG